MNTATDQAVRAVHTAAELHIAFARNMSELCELDLNELHARIVAAGLRPYVDGVHGAECNFAPTAYAWVAAVSTRRAGAVGNLQRAA